MALGGRAVAPRVAVDRCVGRTSQYVSNEPSLSFLGGKTSSPGLGEGASFESPRGGLGAQGNRLAQAPVGSNRPVGGFLLVSKDTSSCV